MSAAANILESLGTALEAAFPDHAVVYGVPAYDGTFAGVGKRLRIHYGQEFSALASQMSTGGRENVRPWIAVTIEQPVSSTDAPDSLERAAAIWDLAADLRGEIIAWILSTRDVPITDAGTLSFVDQTTTPGQLDMGGNTGMESVTVQTTIQFSRTTGGA